MESEGIGREWGSRGWGRERVESEGVGRGWSSRGWGRERVVKGEGGVARGW